MIADTLIALSQPQLKCPPLYKVLIMDDDISTMQCVIDILVHFFNKSENDAYELTMQVHITGCAVAGIYPKDIAETKILLANADLKEASYPLKIQLVKSI